MAPPLQAMHLEVEAISGILGSVSIACWIVVFTPQIIENFRRSSAEGLSIVFIVVWLIGDIFNIIGAVLQKVLPTMIILAVYYTLADIVLMFQCFYYKGFTLKDEVKKVDDREHVDERSALLSQSNGHASPETATERRRSPLQDHAQQLARSNPMHSERDFETIKARSPVFKTSAIKTILFNVTCMVLVCVAGVLGWYLSTGRQRPHHDHSKDRQEDQHDSLHFSLWGQVFGYLCAVFYLGSRLPQLILNYRRQSTEGVSMLFFMFACLGNLTYVLSILAFDPICEDPHNCEAGEKGAIYGMNVLVNLSWIIGSFGTLLLDAGVFVQYFLYKKDDESSRAEADRIEDR